jgi:hypothetical protein
MAERAYTVYGSRTSRFSWRLAALVAMLLLGGLAGAAAFLARADTGHLPPGVEIDGVDVSGLSVGDARARLEEHETGVGAEPIVLTWEGGSLRTSGRELGAQADIDDAIAAALDSRDALSRFRARLGLNDPVEIPLAFTVDPGQLDRVLARAEKRIERKPRSARVQLRQGEVVVRPSAASSTSRPPSPRSRPCPTASSSSCTTSRRSSPMRPPSRRRRRPTR